MIFTPPIFTPPIFAPGIFPRALSRSGGRVIPFTRMAFVGDSITTQIGVASQYYDYGIWSWVAAEMDQKPDIVWNGSSPFFATGGFRTDQVLATHIPTALASNAEGVVVMAGINDLAQSVAPSVAAANLLSIRNAILAAGKTPIICQVLPPRDGDAYAYLASSVSTLNGLINGLASPRTIIVPWCSALETTPGSGLGLSVYFNDSLHPDVDGMRQLCAPFVAAVERYVIERDLFAGVQWVSPNPTLTGAGATPTGWSAEGLSGGVIGTQALTARGGTLGNWWTVPVSGVVGNTTGAQIRYGYGTASGGWAVGDVVEFVGEFELTSGNNFSKLIPILTVQPANTTRRYFASAAATITGGPHPASGVWRSPPINIPSGNTGIWPYVQILGTGTWKFGRVGVRKLP